MSAEIVLSYDFSTVNENYLLSLCYKICIVEVMFNLRNFTQILATVFEIFFVVFCILKCINIF